MRQLCIALTAAGGAMIPEMVMELREISGASIRIVAVDMKENVIGRTVADSFHPVPAGTDSEYSDAMLQICRYENVDVVIPLSDEEAASLSAASDRFAANGIAVLGSPTETTRMAGDKIALLTRLRDCGKATPAFTAVDSVTQFDEGLAALGFPGNPVVCKPANQRGGRGYRLIRNDLDEIAEVFRSWRETETSATRLQNLLGRADPFPKLLLMEYLSGAHFSVDVLVENGVVIEMVAQEKFMAHDLRTFGTRIVDDPRIESAVDDVVSCFAFNHLINIDMGERAPGGDVLSYEVNIRPSALVTGATITGLSLLREAVSRAAGMAGAGQRPRFNGQIQFIGARFV